VRPLSLHKLVGPPVHYADYGTNIPLRPKQRPVFGREVPNADYASVPGEFSCLSAERRSPSSAVLRRPTMRRRSIPGSIASASTVAGPKADCALGRHNGVGP